MDARLSPEQLALRASAAAVVGKLGPHSVGQLDDRARVAKLDAAIDGAGWRELRADAGGGAPLATGVEVAIIAEELGRGLADASFIGPTLASDLRRRLGVPAGPPRETFAFGATFAIDAGTCDRALMLLLEEEGVAELSLAPERTGPDLTRPVARLQIDDAQLVGAATRLSIDDRASWNALGLVLASADLVGVMRGAIELAVDYAKTRRQYDTAIGSFQAVQHLLADALVAMEGSHSATLHAAWAVDALAPDDALSAGAVAKAYCSRAARSVCETAIQVHGGIGNTWDCLAHVYLRRALTSIDLFGGVGANLDRVLAHRGIGAADGLR